MTNDLATMMAAKYYGFFEPARTVQIPGCPHEHEVRVWLPPTYHLTDRAYPTLWVTDNFLEIAHSAVLCSQMNVAPEVILVSIGAPHVTISNADFVARRAWDFFPEAKWWNPIALQMLGNPSNIGGADKFRDYLIDDLRPSLAKEYRMDPNDHALSGHSGGCLFTTYSLFTRPDGFNKYLASSGFSLDYPALAEANFTSLDDISARAYFAYGDSEGPGVSDVMQASLNGMLAVLDQYKLPSFEKTSIVLPGVDHFTIIPVMMQEGVRWLWREGLIGDQWIAQMSTAME